MFEREGGEREEREREEREIEKCDCVFTSLRAPMKVKAPHTPWLVFFFTVMAPSISVTTTCTGRTMTHTHSGDM